MSRRSLVTRYDAQLRGGRRLTMGPARQYSEAPVRPGAGPARLFALEPTTAPTPPAQYFFGTSDYSTGVAPAVPDPARWVNVNVQSSGSSEPIPEGASVLVMAATRGLTESSIDPSWTVLNSGSMGGNQMRWWWLVKPYDGTTYTVGTLSQTPSDAGNYTGLAVRTLVFHGHANGQWHVQQRDSGINAALRLTGPGTGVDPRFRAQMVVGLGFYSGWATDPPRPENSLAFKFGYTTSDLGLDDYILGHPSKWTNTTGRWDQPFLEGSWSYGTIGLAGQPHWATFDVWYG